MGCLALTDEYYNKIEITRGNRVFSRFLCDVKGEDIHFEQGFSKKHCKILNQKSAYSRFSHSAISNYRHFSPTLGRWVSKDPIQEQGGLNLYAFVQNNGINSWDYLGFSCEKEANNLNQKEERVRKLKQRAKNIIDRIKQKIDAIKKDKNNLKKNHNDSDKPAWQSRRKHWKHVNELKKVCHLLLLIYKLRKKNLEQLKKLMKIARKMKRLLVKL